MTAYVTREPTAEDFAQIEADKAEHRANGCLVYDEKFARCTCPEPRCEWSDLLVRECAHCRGITRIEEIEQVRLDEDTLLGVSP